VLRTFLAFIKRDFLIESSYKLSFVFDFLTSLFPVFSYYYICKIFNGSNDEVFISKYGVDYFSFVIVGVALSQYLLLALNVYARNMRRAQWVGSLEVMFNTRSSPYLIILFFSLFSFMNKAFHVIFIFFIGWLFFSVDFSHMNILSTLVILILTMLLYSSLGIFTATLVILIKRSDPFEWILGMTITLLGGAYFPIEVLPSWLEKIASYNPLSYSFLAMRLAVFKNLSILNLWKDILILLLTLIVFLPSSVIIFSWSIRRAKRRGNLMEY
jgi:ABC-2 type transport system permease protein